MIYWTDGDRAVSQDCFSLKFGKRFYDSDVGGDTETRIELRLSKATNDVTAVLNGGSIPLDKLRIGALYPAKIA